MAGINWRNVAGMQDQTQGFANAGALFQRASEQMQGVLQEQIDQETTENTLRAVQQLRGASDVNQLNEIMAGLSGRLDHEAIGTAFNNSRNYITGRTDAAQQQENWQTNYEQDATLNKSTIEDRLARQAIDKRNQTLAENQHGFEVTKYKQGREDTKTVQQLEEALRQGAITVSDHQNALTGNINNAIKRWSSPEGMTDADQNPLMVSGEALKAGVDSFNPTNFYDVRTGEINREAIYDAFVKEEKANDVIASMERNINDYKAMVQASEASLLDYRNQYGTATVNGRTQTSPQLALSVGSAVSALNSKSPSSEFGKALAIDKEAVKTATKDRQEIVAAEKVFNDSPVLKANDAVNNLRSVYEGAFSKEDSDTITEAQKQTGVLFQQLIDGGIPLTGKDIRTIIANSSETSGSTLGTTDNTKFFEALSNQLIDNHLGNLSLSDKQRIQSKLKKAAVANWFSGSIDEIAGASEEYIQVLNEERIKLAGKQ